MLKKTILVFFLFWLWLLVGMNQMGRTWDESFKIDTGILAIDALERGDLSVESWNMGSEHPMVAKYIYGLAGMVDMIRLDGKQKLSPAEQTRLSTEMLIPTQLRARYYAAPYDFGTPRKVAAVFVAFGVACLYWYISRHNEMAAMISVVGLAFMPRFLVMGQLVTFEAITVGFLGLLMVLFEIKNRQRIWWIGVVLGLLFWTRYSNISLLILTMCWDLLREKISKKMFFRWMIVGVMTVAVGFLTWPLIWMEFPKHLISTFSQNSGRGIGINGYYLLQFLITTPWWWLMLAALGIWRSLKDRKGWQKIVLAGLLTQVIFFSLLGVQAGGTRYAISAYLFLAGLSGIGGEYLMKKYAIGKWLVLLGVVFAVISVVRVYPYYLDYYNELVGGVSGAEKFGYEVSWWGEGQREAVLWLNKNIASGTVGARVTPNYVMPPLKRPLEFKGFDYQGEANYWIVSRTNWLKLDEKWRSDKEIIYETKVDGVVLIYILKAK